MIYAAGLSYLFMALVFMAAGIPVYMKAHRDLAEETPEGNTVPECFTQKEMLAALLLCAAALAAIICFAAGIIKL
jgi:hypothetical protein